MDGFSLRLFNFAGWKNDYVLGKREEIDGLRVKVTLLQSTLIHIRGGMRGMPNLRVMRSFLEGVQMAETKLAHAEDTIKCLEFTSNEGELLNCYMKTLESHIQEGYEACRKVDSCMNAG